MTDEQIEHEVHVALETIRKLALLRRVDELSRIADAANVLFWAIQMERTERPR